MTAFAVKHIVEQQGPLVLSLEVARKQPYSFTSKKREAQLAARGCNVYVIEVLVESSQRIYRLGYRYRAFECYEMAGGTLWKGRFKYKNAPKADESPEGVYFDIPVVITDPDFIDWYKNETLGMAEIPEKHIASLEGLIADPSNHVRSF